MLTRSSICPIFYQFCASSFITIPPLSSAIFSLSSLPAFQFRKFKSQPGPFPAVWPRTHCFLLLMLPSEMEIIIPNLKVKVKKTYGQCTWHGEAFDICSSFPFIPIAFSPFNHWFIFLTLSLLSCYSLTLGFKHETQQSILINSLDKGFSTSIFHYHPPIRF